MASYPPLPRSPFTAQTARQLDLSPKQLHKMVRSREVRRVLQGVYVAADIPDSLTLRAESVALVMSPGAVVCDRTAAWLLGVDTLAYWELDLLPPVETVVRPDGTRMRRAQVLGGRRGLLDEDVVEWHGILVTSPRRTALDLGRKLARRDAVAAVDSLMRLHHVTRPDLEADLPRFRGHRGVIQLREVVAMADPRAESPGESWTRVCIVDAGLPVPEAQVWVKDGDHDVFRLDLGYRRVRVGVEFDGVETHSSDGEREYDDQRRAWLEQRGWAIVVVRKDDFTPERIGAWTKNLRLLLEERQRIAGNLSVRRWRQDISGCVRGGKHAP